MSALAIVLVWTAASVVGALGFGLLVTRGKRQQAACNLAGRCGGRR
jgi:hypothetical protein